MARTVQCIQCGVVLNLPDHAAGRRLKCPKCGAKFIAGDPSGQSSVPTRSAPPSGEIKGPDTTFELTRNQSSGDLPVMPTAAGDLRETFDLESMTGAAPPAARPAKTPAATGGREADALALFTDDKPSAPRRKRGAEGRAAARRCPTCGSVVQIGMSLCQTCGLDLDTGTRIDLDEDFAPPPPSRSEGLPITLTIVGGLSAALAAGLGIAAIVMWAKGTNGVQYFIPVAAFGVYAAVQFLRMKSVKLLLIALTLGALIDVVALIAMPITTAVTDIKTVQPSSANYDPDASGEDIRPVTEQLDTQRIGQGVGILALYAATSIYLLSASVQKHFRK